MSPPTRRANGNGPERVRRRKSTRARGEKSGSVLGERHEPRGERNRRGGSARRSASIRRTANTNDAPPDPPKFDLDPHAAALYLHVAAKGQLRDVEGARQPHKPNASPQEKDLLDNLADCLARSKSKDAQDHVSATAMAIDEKAKKIKICIAKNVSGKSMGDSTSEDQQFAKKIGRDLEELSKNVKESRKTIENRMTGFICEFNKSRIEFYVNKINELAPKVLKTSSSDPAWPADARRYAQRVWDLCIANSPENKQVQVLNCVQKALQFRKDTESQRFSRDMETLRQSKQISPAEENAAYLVKYINLLGRPGAAASRFSRFCTNPKYRGYQFEIDVLESPVEEVWNTRAYRQRVESQILRHPRFPRGEVKETQTALDQFMRKSGYRGTARVHCEIQLLMCMSQHESEKWVDYIGCSKKSCWLCWQFLRHFGGYTTKGTHRMIYPMWATQSNFASLPSEFADAFKATSDDMMTLIKDKLTRGRKFSSRKNISHTSERRE